MWYRELLARDSKSMKRLLIHQACCPNALANDVLIRSPGRTEREAYLR
jgi:hypothetical protein